MFNLHPSQKKNKKDTSKKMIQNQGSEVQNDGKTGKDQVGSSKETLPEKQKQKGDDFESNIVLGESSLADNSNRALRDNHVDSNSKLPMKDGKGADCECTNRLSPVEDEYNWSLPIGENPNMSIFSIKEDSTIKTNKKNAGCKRKLRDNQKGDGKKDVTTCSASKIVKIKSVDDGERIGNTADTMSSPNTIRSHK
ncbi:hypothetical protein A4A49_52506 [Nicotiana attenuata]|uniref:Uncharacterized protein n=1 Tax=Nicotiana attenuata TaxID=49451 RepID=A0A1J6IMD2_NICAT|nr:hypothetical protein A4A49_52506 [Nicotiana attenuata]